ANSLPPATHGSWPTASVGSEKFQPQAVDLTGVDSMQQWLSPWLLSATLVRLARSGDGGLGHGLGRKVVMSHRLVGSQWHSDLAPACANHAIRSHVAGSLCHPARR